MISVMDDWEQPNTTAMRTSPGAAGGDTDIQGLQQQLAEALDRIAALEQRVKQLEGRAQTA
jgi:hypothetical protein